MTMSHFSLAAVLFAFGLSACAQDNEAILKSVAVDGGEMEYAEYGNSEGEPVILIHGGFVADAFLPMAQTEELSDFRLILVHLRGYAGSSRVEIPFGTAEYAQDIVTLMDSLDIASAHWVGHSLGAVISLRAAIEYPQRLKSISLIEPGGVPSQLSAQYPTDLPTCQRSGGRAGQESYTSQETQAFLAFVACNSFGGKETLDALPGAYEQALVDMPAFRVQMRTPSWPFEPETHLPSLQQPILYIHFDGSNPVQPEFAELFVEHHGETEVVELEGTHHSFHIEQPQQTAEVIASFLGRHLAH